MPIPSAPSTLASPGNEAGNEQAITPGKGWRPALLATALKNAGYAEIGVGLYARLAGKCFLCSKSEMVIPEKASAATPEPVGGVWARKARIQQLVAGGLTLGCR